MLKKNLLLIGCGNHGERLLRLLEKKRINILVLEKDNKKILNLKRKYPQINLFQDKSQLLREYKGKIDFSVVSNWAIDHYSYILFSSELGCKKVFVEKPLVASINEINKLKKLFSKNFIIVPSQYTHFLDTKKKLKNMEKKYKLKNLNYISCTGGAKGFVNNGIHNLDIAIQAFGTIPTRGTGHIKPDRINPRNNSLDYFEGSIVYEFPKDKIFHLSFKNTSMLDSSYQFQWDYGRLIVRSDNSFFIEHIKDVTKRALPKTRTTVGNFIEGENFFGEYLEALNLNLDYFLSDAISYQDYKEFFFSKLDTLSILYYSMSEASKYKKNTRWKVS